jgi:hypothetical protein
MDDVVRCDDLQILNFGFCPFLSLYPTAGVLVGFVMAYVGDSAAGLKCPWDKVQRAGILK